MQYVHRYHVLTGASGSGKSSILAALAARGLHCISEAGRQVVRDEVSAGSNGTPWQDSDRFMDLVFALNLRQYQSVPEGSAPVFFDRAIPECVGSAIEAGQAPPADRWQAAMRFRYARVVFVTPPWREIYVNDAERRHSFEQGVAHHRAELAGYAACGYELLEVPRWPVEARVAFILKAVGWHA